MTDTCIHVYIENILYYLLIIMIQSLEINLSNLKSNKHDLLKNERRLRNYFNDIKNMEFFSCSSQKFNDLSKIKMYSYFQILLNSL